VCEYCVSGQSCDHGTGTTGSTPCSCSLAGTKKCPGCGCECASWDWGLGFVGPSTVRSFFGVGDDENPGFSGYPASKAQLVAAATQELEEAESSSSDVQWLSKNLPEATYPDRGSALAALSSTISWPENDPTAVVARLPMQAIATGTRLVVGRDQAAVLVGKSGHPLDAFGPGEKVITRETAPRAAAESRPAAPQFAKSVISATPLFASTREIRTDFNRTGRTRSGEPVTVRGSMTFSIASLADFLARAKSPGRGISAKEVDAVVAGIVGPAIDQILAAHDARDFDGPSKLLEDSIRSSAGSAGLRVAAVSLNPVGRMSPADRLAAVRERQAEVLSHMPPEVQAQMAQAMQRAQASRGPPPPPPATGAASGKPAAPSSPGAAQVCPSCQAPNPTSVRFCGNCGKPLPTKRLCPRCGTEAAPGVKFCGNCGGPVG
jgi:hypothetical protein